MNTRLREAEAIIDRILSWALANRDSEHEFVTCYTYNHGECPEEIAAAKRFLGETVDHFKRIVPTREDRR